MARNYFGFHDAVDVVMNEALEVLKRQGATLVDPAELPNMDKVGDPELMVLLYELKADLNAYLARLGPSAPVRSLKEIIDFNDQHKAEEMPFFGQDQFLKAEAKEGLTSKEYLEALEKCRRLTRTEGIDAVMDKHKLDALVAPSDGPAWLTDLVDGDHSLGDQHDRGSGGRLPEHHRAGRLRLWFAGRHLVLRPGLERRLADQTGVCI